MGPAAATIFQGPDLSPALLRVGADFVYVEEFPVDHPSPLIPRENPTSFRSHFFQIDRREFAQLERSGYGKRSEEHTSELQSPCNLVCRLLLEKKKKYITRRRSSSRKSTLKLAATLAWRLSPPPHVTPQTHALDATTHDASKAVTCSQTHRHSA